MGIHENLYIAHRAPVKYVCIQGVRRHGELTGVRMNLSARISCCSNALALSASFHEHDTPSQ